MMSRAEKATYIGCNPDAHLITGTFCSLSFMRDASIDHPSPSCYPAIPPANPLDASPELRVHAMLFQESSFLSAVMTLDIKFKIMWVGLSELGSKVDRQLLMKPAVGYRFLSLQRH